MVTPSFMFKSGLVYIAWTGGRADKAAFSQHFLATAQFSSCISSEQRYHLAFPYTQQSIHITVAGGQHFSFGTGGYLISILHLAHIGKHLVFSFLSCKAFSAHGTGHRR